MARAKAQNPVRSTAGDQRREALIAAAYALFMARGYGDVSVDDIIREAGGSKATLYKFFGNKEGMLRAVVAAHAEKMLRGFTVELPAGCTARESLTHLGTVLAEFALSENAIGQHRHAVASAAAFPDISRMWFDNGPDRTIEGIAAFLRREVAAGRLRIDDTRRAAWFFGGMILFKDNMRLLVGLPAGSKVERKQAVARAVDVFLAAYGA